ncbi:YggT family protein [Candidatus Saccharibacteria bacterium TM7i]|nr:YggT family protein [Candidatus Saccharibacteria bacterium TM7i]
MQETEVRETNTQNGNTVVQKRRIARSELAPGVVVLQRIVWFIAGLISVIIAMRFVFLLLGANREAGFTDFIYSASSPFVAPFTGIFGEPVYGTSVFEVSSLLAITVYLLIAWGVAKLFTLARPQDEV